MNYGVPSLREAYRWFWINEQLQQMVRDRFVMLAPETYDEQLRRLLGQDGQGSAARTDDGQDGRAGPPMEGPGVIQIHIEQKQRIACDHCGSPAGDFVSEIKVAREAARAAYFRFTRWKVRNVLFEQVLCPACVLGGWAPFRGEAKEITPSCGMPSHHETCDCGGAGGDR